MLEDFKYYAAGDSSGGAVSSGKLEGAVLSVGAGGDTDFSNLKETGQVKTEDEESISVPSYGFDSHHTACAINFQENDQDKENKENVPLDCIGLNRNMQIVNGQWKRIPRPLNAFMIFSNEKRKQLKAEHPGEANNLISTRLGQMWKALPDGEKKQYQERAHKGDIEHRRKYPHYQYCPGQARKLKRARKEQRKAQMLAKQAQAEAAAAAARLAKRDGLTEGAQANGCSVAANGPLAAPTKRGRPKGSTNTRRIPYAAAMVANTIWGLAPTVAADAAVGKIYDGAQTYTTPSAMACGQKMTSNACETNGQELRGAMVEELCYPYGGQPPFLYVPYESLYGPTGATAAAAGGMCPPPRMAWPPIDPSLTMGLHPLAHHMAYGGVMPSEGHIGGMYAGQQASYVTAPMSEEAGPSGSHSSLQPQQEEEYGTVKVSIQLQQQQQVAAPNQRQPLGPSDITNKIVVHEGCQEEKSEGYEECAPPGTTEVSVPLSTGIGCDDADKEN